MKIRFLTLVEKKVPRFSKPYYLILRLFNLQDGFCKSLKNNIGVRKSEVSFFGFTNSVEAFHHKKNPGLTKDQDLIINKTSND